MDLDLTSLDDLFSEVPLDLPAARGRPSRGHFAVGEPRVLEAEDILQHSVEDREPSRQAPLKAIRARHHQLAQLLATGMKEMEASVMTGFSASRISVMKADPAFKDLMSYYQDQNERLSLDMRERLAQVSTMAVEEIHERLDQDPDSITTAELAKLAEMGLDRTGHGKTATVKHEFGLTAEEAERLKQRAATQRRGQIFDLGSTGVADEPAGPEPSVKTLELRLVGEEEEAEDASDSE